MTDWQRRTKRSTVQADRRIHR